MLTRTRRLFVSRAFLRRYLAIFATQCLCANAFAAGVLPTGGQYVAGQGTIMTAPKGVVVNQSSARGIVNWQGFSIGTGNTVQFNNGTGATLNRVTGGNLSQIDGLLKATGSIYLINPQGIVVGSGGKIVTKGSFVGSTRDVNSNDFMNGNALHATGTSSGNVVNQGSITSQYGDTILVGNSVSNSGNISAPNGTAGVAAGNDVLLRPMGGDSRIAVSGGLGNVTNTGTVAAAQAELAAAGGNVYALAGNSGGLVSATGTKTVDGHVWLTSGNTTQVSGTVKAVNANGVGGTIIATGKNVQVDSTARISASGTSGGTVLIGGDQRGGSDPSLKRVSASVANAQTATVAKGAQISANGTQGAGGAVVVWSDATTSYDGLISATGLKGNGGDVEVSSHGVLNFTGLVDLTSQYGDIGKLLLDPNNLSITTTGPTANVGTSPNYVAGVASSVLKASDLVSALGFADVTVTASGTLTVSSAVTWTTAHNLTLDAGGTMSIGSAISGANATITLKSGGAITGSGAITATALQILPDASTVQAVTLTANNSIGTLAANVASLSFKNSKALVIGTAGATSGINATGTLTLNVNGAITDPSASVTVKSFVLSAGNWTQNIATLPTFTAATSFTISGGSFLRATGGNGAAATPYQIADIYGLQGLQTLSTPINTVLVQDINASGTSTWNSNAGFVPFGGFGDTLDGQNHTITGLTINQPSTMELGMIVANTGTIKNLNLASVNIKGAGQMGGLVGYNGSGTINNVTIGGTVTGTSGSLGGLVGYNDTAGSIINSSSSVNVTGSTSTFSSSGVGGLVGLNFGSISGSSASGTAKGFSAIGGLVGGNEAGATITGSNATGLVTATFYDQGSVNVGGLVGDNIGGIDSSYATGGVTLASQSGSDSTFNIGGLVGFNESGATITNSHASGTVKGMSSVGGLVGANQGSIDGSYSDATILSVSTKGVGMGLGGLVGLNGDGFSTGGTITNSYAIGNVSGPYDVGGLIGWNGVNSIVTGSHSGGTVGASGNSTNPGQIGGFVGENDAVLDNAYSTATVTLGTTAGYVGGFVGENSGNGTITNSNASGTVSGGATIGGFVGGNDGNITGSYASGAVSGTSTVGGFVGINATGNPAAALSDDYATGNVTALTGGGGAGGFAGMNNATITSVYATGTVTGDTGLGATLFSSVMGGLIGTNYGSVSLSHATGVVTGGRDIGGLIGENMSGATVSGSYSTGNVQGGYTQGGAVNAGGLVGHNQGSIATSYAQGTVTATDDGQNFDNYDQGMGGLVGFNDAGSISQSYATGAVTGVRYVGGLIGEMIGGTVSDVYSTGNVSGEDTVAGLIGYYDAGTTSRGYSSGSVTVQPGGSVGALVGTKFGGTLSNVYWNKTITGSLIGVGYNVGTNTNVAGLTTTQMMDGANQATNFKNFDFTNTWSPAGNGFMPQLFGVSYVVNVKAGGNYQYGDPIAPTYLGFQNGDTAAIVNGLIFTTNATGTPQVGQTYTASASGATATSSSGIPYRFIYNNGTVTITARQLTVQADAISETYGNTDPALTYQLTSGSLLSGDSFTGSLTRQAGSNAGSYNILQGSLAVNTNYQITFLGATFTINPATLTYTATSAERIYGSGNPTFAGTVTGFVNGETLASATTGATTFGSSTTASTNVGNYAITGSGLTANHGNYVFVQASGNSTALKIDPATLTYVATAASRAYGSPNPAITGTVTGYVLGQNQGSATTGTLKWTAGATSTTANVGGYFINGSGLTAKNGNYTIVQDSGNATALTITPKVLTWSISGGSTSGTYGTLSTLGTVVLNGKVGSDTVNGVAGLMDSGGNIFTYIATTDAGTYSEVAATLTGAKAGNYTLAAPSGTLKSFVINPKTISYSIANSSGTYGTLSNPGTVTLSGVVSGDSALVSGTVGLFSGSTAVPYLFDTDAGTYTTKVTGLAGTKEGDYVIAASGNTNAIYTINQATLTYTTADAGGTYGTVANLGAISFSGLAAGDGSNIVGTEGLFAGATAVPYVFNTNAGSYSQQVTGISGAGSSNYILASTGNTIGTFTISPLAITVTGNSASKIYGDGAPGYGYSITSGALVAGDILGNVDVSSIGDAATADKGQYDITTANAVFSSGLASNYDITYGTLTGGLTVSARAITVVGNAASKVYGDGAPAYGYTVSSGTLVNGDTLGSVDVSSAGDAVTASKGQYDIATANALFSSGDIANYDITYDTLANGLTVTARAITVMGNAASKVYGDGAPAYGYTVTTGNLANSDAIGSIDIGSTGDAATAGKGQYDVTAADAVFSAGDISNYDITYGTLTNGLTVTARPVTLTGDAASKIYGDGAPAYGYGITSGNLANGDTLASVDVSSIGDAVTANKGQYDVTTANAVFSLGDISNYDITYGTLTNGLTVAARAITLVGNAASKVYGDGAPAYGYTVSSGTLVNGDTLGSVDVSSAGDAVTASKGQYDIATANALFSSGDIANYDITYDTLTNGLTVTARAITLTGDLLTRIYGDANPASSTGSVTSGSLANGDTISGVDVLSSTASTTSNVGNGYSYSIGNAAFSSGDISNYDVTYADGSLTINVRPITVTADAQSRIYGNANPALTFTTSDLGAGADLQGSLDTAASNTTSVGNYAITQGSVTNANNGNYDISYVGANLLINARPITIVADAQTRTYGDANPALTYVIGGDGLVNGDTLTGGLATGAGVTSNVGGYAITQNSLAASDNYTVSYTSGTLTVTPRALTVSADDFSRIYGDANPSLTYGITGGNLVNGDTLSGGLATAAALTSNVGSYAVTQGSLAASSNYALTYVGGTLAVTPRAITVTADNLSRIYGSANPLLTYTIGGRGLVNGDTLTGGLATSASLHSNAGTYGIAQGNLASSPNYVLTFNAGTLALTPASLLISADDSSALTLAAAQPTASYIGLVAGDTSSVVTGLQLGLFPVTDNPFAYDIVPFGASAQNYAISYAAGLLTLTARPSNTFTSPVTPGGALGTLPSLVLVTGSGTFTFSNVATAGIGADPSILLFDAGLPGDIGVFNQFVITDYSNAIDDSDRLVAAE